MVVMLLLLMLLNVRVVIVTVRRGGCQEDVVDTAGLNYDLVAGLVIV